MAGRSRPKRAKLRGNSTKAQTDFEEYLIPRSLWAAKRIENYANLELPLDADAYIARLNDHLKKAGDVDRRVPNNKALTIYADNGEFHLAALKALEKRDPLEQQLLRRRRFRP